MPVMDHRAQAVMDGFKHAFHGYRKYAWGADEFKPEKGVGKANVWGGMGMMILDAMDTAMIMGLDDDVAQCVKWIDEQLHFEKVGKVSYFETTIRALGGLLSAYSLFGESEPILLRQALDLAKRLVSPQKNAHHDFAPRYVNLATGASSSPRTSLAEVGSNMLELRYLAKVSDESQFAEQAHTIWKHLLPNLKVCDYHFTTYLSMHNES